MDQSGHVQRSRMTKQVCACCTSSRLTYCSIFVLLLSLTFLSVAIFIPAVIDDKLDSGISDFLALTPEAKANGDQGYVTWSDWTDSRAPSVYYLVSVFNITNNITHVLHGEKPQVQEIGPYVYREYKIKLNTEFSVDDEGHAMVKYQDYVYYIFDRERTPAHLNPYTDDIYTVNMIFQAFKGGAPSIDMNVVIPIFKNWNITIPVDLTSNDLVELVFGDLWGYTDVSRLCASFKVHDLLWGSNQTILSLFGQTWPGILQNTTQDKISSILYDTIYTGDGTDPALLRSYVKWQEMDYLAVPVDQLNKTGPLWNSPRANRVHGTDGTQFPRNLKKGEPLVTFITDLFRAGTLLNVNGQVNSFKGIDLLHFTIDNQTFANSSTYPSNADYNINGVSGVLNITKAAHNIPVVLSKPHFLDVGYPVNQLVTGDIKPNRDAHDTFLDIEPITGATMNAAKRIQINVNVQPYDAHFTIDGHDVKLNNETWFAHINDQTLIPIAWVEESGSLSDSQAHDFKSQVYFAQSARYYVKWVGYAAGIAWGIFGIFIFLLAKSRNSIETLKSLTTDADLEHYEALTNPTGY